MAVDMDTSWLDGSSVLGIGWSALLAAVLLLRCEPAPAPEPAVSAAASAPAPPSPRLPTDPELQVKRFDNGVTFVSRAKPNPSHRATLALIVGVGSLVEQEDERGLAHFVEHMAFNGTKNLPRSELARFLEGRGLAVGADVNARTTHRATSYFLELPGDDSALLDRGVAILEEWGTNIVFDSAAIEQEKGIVLAEMRVRGREQHLLERVSAEWLLAGTRYAERGVLGLEGVIGSASTARLERFYRRWYQPQHFTIVAYGDFDTEAMERRIARHFGAIPTPIEPEVAPRFDLPSPAGEHVLTHADPALETRSVAVYLQRKLEGYATQADYRERILGRVVARVLHRRLQGLPAKQGSGVLGASASYYEGDPGYYDVIHLSAASGGDPKLALGALLTELERLARHGVSEHEVQVAAGGVQDDWVRETNARGPREYADWLAVRVAHGVATPSPSQQVALLVRLLAGLTPGEVHQHAQLWAERASRHLLALGREAAELPDEAALRQVAAEVRRAAIAPRDEAPEGPLMSSLPEPGGIVSKQYEAAIDAHVWVLSNGARVVFKRMPNDRWLEVAATSPGGYFRARGTELVNARLAGILLWQLGLGEHDATTIRRRLSEARVMLLPSLDEYSEGMGGRAPVESSEEMFQALHLLFVAPRFDRADFEVARSRMREVLVQQLADPKSALLWEIERQMLRDHPAHVPLPPAAAAELDPDIVRALHADRFDAGDFTFVLVGETTEAALEPLIQRYIGSLPGRQRADAALRPEVSHRSGITRIRMKRAGGDTTLVRLVFHGGARLSHGAELEPLREYLGLRLREVLREEMGDVYSVETFSSRRAPPRHGYEIGLEFECAPARCEALVRAALDVVSALRDQGPVPHLMATLNGQRERRAAADLTSARFWLSELTEAYRRNEDAAASVSRLAKPTRVSSAALRTAARRYLQPGQYLDARLEPEHSASADGPPQGRGNLP